MSTPSTVPNFLEEEDYSDGPQMVPMAPPVNPILDGDDREYDEDDASSPSSVLTTDAVRTEERSQTDADLEAAERAQAPAARYGRRKLGDRDDLAMAFLRKFSLVSSKQMGIVLGVKARSAYKRMLGLQDLGMVNTERLPGMNQLWYLTQKGHAFLNFRMVIDDRVPKPHKAGRVYFGKLGHSLAVTQAAAQLVGGVSQIPESIGVDLPVGLEMLQHLVPEQYMNRTFSAAFSDPQGKLTQGDYAWKKQREARKSIEEGHLNLRSALRSMPELWTVVPPGTSQKDTKSNHPADLVIDLEHLRESLAAPRSIALEIELHLKDAKELRRIAGAFHTQTTKGAIPVFAEVVYLTNNKSIVEAVISAAKQAGAQTIFKARKLTDADGATYSGKAWEL